jgi:urease accessory protein
MVQAAGWLGRLSLGFERLEHGTQLSRREHEGPLRVQRVLKPEGALCPHVYLLHPPGGVVGGDRLHTAVELGASSAALLTTPAAQKLYRSAGATSEIENLLSVGEGATLEWLPSETLAFSAARASSTTRVTLGAGAAFLGWDITCYGMPARGERFEAGRVSSRFEIYRGRTPLLIDSFDFTQEQDLLRGAFALRGQPVSASLYAAPPGGSLDESLVSRVRDVVGFGEGELRAVSSLRELLVVRVLAPSVEAARAPLLRAWQLLRPELLARPPVTPRIWAT